MAAYDYTIQIKTRRRMRACSLSGLLAILIASVYIAGPNPALANGGYIKGPSRDRVMVFVNGVLGDGVSTWTHSNGTYWPKLVAADREMEDSDVYVHTFVSPPVTDAQNVEELAGRMAAYLEADGVFARHREVVFVCHSMGGLVVRAMLLKSRLDPARVPLIYFFGTPTMGANVSRIGALVSQNPQFKFMLPFDENTYIWNLVHRWLDTADDPKANYPARVRSYCAYEKKAIYGVVIVEEKSAIALCNRSAKAVLADHIEMVKPQGSYSEAHSYLKAAYIQTFRASGSVIALGVKEGSLDLKNVQASLTANGFPENFAIQLVGGAEPEYRAAKITVPIPLSRVRCGEVRRGRLAARVTLSEGEEIVAADVTPVGYGLKSIGTAIFSVSGENVEIAFKAAAQDARNGLCEEEPIYGAQLNVVKALKKSPFVEFRKSLPF